MASSTENIVRDQQIFTDAIAKISTWRQIEGVESDGSYTALKNAPPDVKDAYFAAILAISRLKPEDTDPWMLEKIQIIIRKSTRYIIYLDERFEIQWWWIIPPNDVDNLTLLQTHITQIETESNFLMEKVGKPSKIINFFSEKAAGNRGVNTTLAFSSIN